MYEIYQDLKQRYYNIINNDFVATSKENSYVAVVYKKLLDYKAIKNFINEIL